MLPNDPFMLLSAMNMKLRDGALSPEDICAEEEVLLEEVTKKLASIGYFYSESHRAYIAK